MSSSNRLLNTVRGTAACVAILAASAALLASPAQAGSIVTTNCLHGFGHGYAFSYHRSYNNGWGDGYLGGNASGYGNGSSSGYGDGGCVTVRGELTNPYVIPVPQPQTEKDIADAAARERLWQARCKPVIRQDQHGVRRYHYAAPGCEYGKYE